MTFRDTENLPTVGTPGMAWNALEACSSLVYGHRVPVSVHCARYGGHGNRYRELVRWNLVSLMRNIQIASWYCKYLLRYGSLSHKPNMTLTRIFNKCFIRPLVKGTKHFHHTSRSVLPGLLNNDVRGNDWGRCDNLRSFSSIHKSWSGAGLGN